MERVNTPDDRDQILFDMAVLMYEMYMAECVPLWAHLYLINHDYLLAKRMKLNISSSHTMHYGIYFPTLNYN